MKLFGGSYKSIYQCNTSIYSLETRWVHLQKKKNSAVGLLQLSSPRPGPGLTHKPPKSVRGQLPTILLRGHLPSGCRHSRPELWGRSPQPVGGPLAWEPHWVTSAMTSPGYFGVRVTSGRIRPIRCNTYRSDCPDWGFALLKPSGGLTGLLFLQEKRLGLEDSCTCTPGSVSTYLFPRYNKPCFFYSGGFASM